MRSGLLGLLAGPIMLAQCGPTQCSPAPVEPVPPPPAPVTAPPTAPPTAPATSTTTTTTTTVEAPVALVSWAFLQASGGLYTRWNPCADPIRYQIDTTLAPSADVRNAITSALAAATDASGHVFEYVGDAGATLRPDAEVVIGVRDFSGSTLGQGGGRFTASLQMVTGSVYVDADIADDAANTDAALLRTTLLHEIGHMLGLGHVPDDAQVMYTFVRTPPQQSYQWGDLEGLRRVGTRLEPCLASLQAMDEPTTEILLE